MSDERKPDPRVWAWALAAIILVAGLVFCLGINWRQHAPEPLLHFLERSGSGGPAPK